MHQQRCEHNLPSMRNIRQRVHLSDAVTWRRWRRRQKGELSTCSKRNSTSTSRGAVYHSCNGGTTEYGNG